MLRLLSRKFLQGENFSLQSIIFMLNYNLFKYNLNLLIYFKFFGLKLRAQEVFKVNQNLEFCYRN